MPPISIFSFMAIIVAAIMLSVVIIFFAIVVLILSRLVMPLLLAFASFVTI